MNKTIEAIFFKFKQMLKKYDFTDAVSLKSNQCFDFACIKRNKRDVISFAYHIRGSLIMYTNFHSRITFNEVVKIVNFIDPNINTINIIKNHPKINQRYDVVDQLTNTVIVENNKLLEPEFEQLLITLEDYICRYILPFFDRVSSLQVVNDEIIEVVPHMELHKYISGNLILKKLIIMKLCNNPKYDDFVQWMDVRCQESLLLINDPMHYRYVETYDQFKKLVSYLASGAYLDLVKE